MEGTKRIMTAGDPSCNPTKVKCGLVQPTHLQHPFSMTEKRSCGGSLHEYTLEGGKKESPILELNLFRFFAPKNVHVMFHPLHCKGLEKNPAAFSLSTAENNSDRRCSILMSSSDAIFYDLTVVRWCGTILFLCLSQTKSAFFE